MKRSPGCFLWSMRESIAQWGMEKSRGEMKGLFQIKNLKWNKHKMQDRKREVAKEREFMNKVADGTGDYVSSTSELSLLFTGEAMNWRPTTWFTICPSSHNLLYISKSHRHRGAWVSPFSLPMLVYCPWLQIRSQSNIKNLACLVLCIENRNQWLPERSLFTAEMSASSSIFGWIQWETDACVLSYMKWWFSVIHRNSTEQDVSQGHCHCCACCKNILKLYIFSAFLF